MQGRAKREVEPMPFGFLNYLAVVVECRPVLRRGRRDQPPVVADQG